MRRVLFTLCGRAGSKGIKGKNTRSFLGIPLVYYTLAAIDLTRQSIPELDLVVALNTDSPELVELVRSSGVPFEQVNRPEELADDKSSKVSVIGYTMKKIEDACSCTFDYVVDLDITSPLRTVDDVSNVLEKRQSSRADTVFTVTGSRRNPCFNMVCKNDQGYYDRIIASDFNTRQDAPVSYDMNASIYAYKPDFLRSGKQIFEGTCDIVLMKDTAVLDLDDSEDFELMEVIAEHLFATKKGYRAIWLAASRLARGVEANC